MVLGCSDAADCLWDPCIRCLLLQVHSSGGCIREAVVGLTVRINSWGSRRLTHRPLVSHWKKKSIMEKQSAREACCGKFTTITVTGLGTSWKAGWSLFHLGKPEEVRGRWVSTSSLRGGKVSRFHLCSWLPAHCSAIIPLTQMPSVFSKKTGHLCQLHWSSTELNPTQFYCRPRPRFFLMSLLRMHCHGDVA